MKDKINIHNYLPHRAPMLMVDHVLNIDESHVKTSFLIQPDNIFVENLCFSEVGLIEHAAQTCSAIVAKSYFFDENNEEKQNVKVLGFISGIKKLNVISLPEINTEIITDSVLISKFESLNFSVCTMKCSTFCKGALLFEAEINLYIQEEKP